MAEIRKLRVLLRRSIPMLTVTKDTLTGDMTMTNEINFAEIEANARKMRAEVARAGFFAVRRAVTNAFSALTFRGSKPA